jgi:hypothetical protein
MLEEAHLSSQRTNLQIYRLFHLFIIFQCSLTLNKTSTSTRTSYATYSPRRVEGIGQLAKQTQSLENNHTQKTSDRQSNFSSHTTPTCLLVALLLSLLFLLWLSSLSQKIAVSQWLLHWTSLGSVQIKSQKNVSTGWNKSCFVRVSVSIQTSNSNG